MLHCALFSATSGLNALPSISRDSPLPVNLPPVSPKVWGNFADSIMHYVKRYCLERNTVRARHKVRDFSLFLVVTTNRKYTAGCERDLAEILVHLDWAERSVRTGTVGPA